MHMAKGTIVSLFTVFSAYISSVQCREATSGNRVEEAGVDLGGGDHICIYMHIDILRQGEQGFLEVKSYIRNSALNLKN